MIKCIIKTTAFFSALLYTGVSAAQVSYTDSLLKELTRAKEDTGKVLLLRNIGNALANEDAAKAITYWKAGAALGKKISYPAGIARNFINIGTGFGYLGKFDSSIIYCDSAIVYCKLLNDADKLALAYLNKADGFRGLEDFQTALFNCDTARIYAEKTTNTDRQARIYTIISSIYTEQNQFDNALHFLDKAVTLYKKDGNLIMVGQSYDDRGIIFREQGKLDSAMIFRKMAIAIAEQEKDYKNLSTYYYGVADIYSAMGKYDEAVVNAGKSIAYARDQENNLQSGTAYSLLCRIYLKKEKFKDAVTAGQLAWKLSLSDGPESLQQQSAALLAEAYTGTGNYKEANHFLTISSNLKDTLAQKLFSTQVTRLQSSFELKEKDKAILLLSKDGQLQQQKLFRQRVLFVAVAALLLFSLLAIALLINRNRMKQRVKELELRNRIAADLHDEVGSSLSSIHMLSQMAVQNGNENTHKDILQRMSSNAKETMEKMGDIVWMIKPGETEAGNLKQRMERFAYEMCSAKNIVTSLQLEELEKIKLSMEQRKNVYLIFKEALNNAVKYSGTEKIEVTALQKNNELILKVTDFGKGFDSASIKKGNGLDNMKNRAKELGALLHIISDNGAGTTIQLAMPA